MKSRLLISFGALLVVFSAALHAEEEGPLDTGRAAVEEQGAEVAAASDPAAVEPDASEVAEAPEAAESAGASDDGDDEAEAKRPLFFGNFYAHEPIYFILGDRSDGAKFQLSFKYRFFNPDGPLARRLPWVDDFYLGYSQVSLWDVYDESSPFKDTNYKPELMYFKEKQWGELGWIKQLDMQGGVRHESNGQTEQLMPNGEFENLSRSINYIYARPVFHFGDVAKYHLWMAPRAWFYVGDLSDNPDIADYRGYADLELSLGKHDGAELRSLFRLGIEGKGSVQLDFTYPLSEIFFRNLAFYFYTQFFTGYGETLLTYNEKDTAIRFGFGLSR